jgi:hypothetical protein
MCKFEQLPEYGLTLPRGFPLRQVLATFAGRTSVLGRAVWGLSSPFRSSLPAPAGPTHYRTKRKAETSMGKVADFFSRLGGKAAVHENFKQNTRTVRALAHQAGLAAERAVETELSTTGAQGAQEPHQGPNEAAVAHGPHAALAAPHEAGGGVPGSLTGHVPGTSFGGARGPLPGTEGSPPGGG